jgi:shikimate dehydrogenase
MNGKLMLLFQGAESFFLWTGRKMPVDIIRERLFED